MANYQVGQKVLIKTSYRGGDGKFILAGRPGIIVGQGDRWTSEYQIEVQMPDGPYTVTVRQSTNANWGFLLDTPKNRSRYPIPDWEQIDLKELHWPKRMSPVGMKVRSDAFGGFMAKIAMACGAIDATEQEMDITSSDYHWGNLEYARESSIRTYIFPSKARAKAFWELLRWAEWYGKEHYVAGVKAGHNLLLQLNQGELTMDTFNKRVAEEMRIESYERHVWDEEDD